MQSLDRILDRFDVLVLQRAGDTGHKLGIEADDLLLVTCLLERLLELFGHKNPSARPGWK